MKKLLFIALLIAGRVYSINCPNNTIGVWNFENNVLPECGNISLVNNSSVDFGTSSPTPFQGVYWAGNDFLTTAFFSGGVDLRAAVSNLAQHAFLFYFNVSSLVAGNGLFSFSNAGNNIALGMRTVGTVGTDATARFLVNGNIDSDVSTAVKANAWYRMEVTYDATNGSRYYLNVTGAAKTLVAQTATNPSLGTVTAITMGKLNEVGFEFPVVGVIDAFCFGSKSTGCISVDPNTVRAMKLSKQMRMGLH